MDFDKHQAILNHHEVLLGTFFLSLEKNPKYLHVTTNVKGVSEWEYVIPFNENIPPKKNIYTRECLSMQNLKLTFKDAWLVRSIVEEKELQEFQFVKVKSCSEMQIFIDGFREAYFSNDKSELSIKYCDTLLNAYKNGQSKLTYFYVLNNDNQLVGVSAIAILKQYSFSYCIGVVPHYRGKKISMILLDHHSNYAKKANCQFQVLQAEKGSFVEKLYIKNHFILFEIMNHYHFI
jgi:hypothetical protein